MKQKILPPKLKSYTKDGRKSVQRIYKSFSKFNELWASEIIYYQQADRGKNKKILLPIFAFKTKRQGNALWIISGIHGEEPAGVNAIVKNIWFLNRLAKKFPLVVIPLANPSGYWRNWRYPNRKYYSKKDYGLSVGDAEFFLPSLKNPKKSRAQNPSSEIAFELNNFIIEMSKKYPPILVLDFHEDTSGRKFYLYLQGKLGVKDPIAEEIIKIARINKFDTYTGGQTNFKQKIINGIVGNTRDGSITELLSSNKIIKNGKIFGGPNAKSVIVVETNPIGIKLKKRIKIHSEIIKNSERFFEMAKETI